MQETSKNKWIAVVTAIVITAFFFGGYGLYSFNKNVESTITNSSTNTKPIIMDTITDSQELIIQDIVIGTGETAAAGQTISANYMGTLQNGTKFDSSYDRGKPFEFTLGVGQVIKGWDQGIVGMKVGGKRKLIIPSSLAYGSQAVGGVIPANATLIFEVELVGIKK